MNNTPKELELPKFTRTKFIGDVLIIEMPFKIRSAIIRSSANWTAIVIDSKLDKRQRGRQIRRALRAIQSGLPAPSFEFKPESGKWLYKGRRIGWRKTI